MSNTIVSSVYISASLWLERGWHVLPCQPGSKRLCTSYGVNLKNADPWEEINYWFQRRDCNLAVYSNNSLVLDFDDFSAYEQFQGLCPDLAVSYTEATPRGGRHVFLKSSDRVRYGVFQSVEVRRSVLVFPSIVGDRAYKISVPGRILTFPVWNALQAFSRLRGEKLPDFPATRGLGLPVVKNGLCGGNRGIMAKVKAAWPLLDYLSKFEPELHLVGNGRWLSGHCPWHDDKNPSLWVDGDRNTWGCHACENHGDVVNWHALRIGAVSQLAAAIDLDRMGKAKS